MVNVKNLTVVLNNQTVLDNVSCTLLPGRITCFMGESGAGKTTLLKAMVQLVPYEQGAITVGNKELRELNDTQRAEAIGYVFQQFNLFANLTALENCVDPLVVHGMNKNDAQRLALVELQKFGMEQYANSYPEQLSGGQQQRVAIIRSLCLKPQVLLLDEPTASLDPINTQSLIGMLQAVAAQGLTIGVSSQDMNFVRKIFDRCYYLAEGGIREFCDDAQKLDACPVMKQFMQN